MLSTTSRVVSAEILFRHPRPRRSAFVNEWRCWRMEAEKNGGKVIAGAPFTLVGARLRSLLLSHVSAYGVI